MSFYFIILRFITIQCFLIIFNYSAKLTFYKSLVLSSFYRTFIPNISYLYKNYIYFIYFFLFHPFFIWILPLIIFIPYYLIYYFIFQLIYVKSINQSLKLNILMENRFLWLTFRSSIELRLAKHQLWTRRETFFLNGFINIKKFSFWFQSYSFRSKISLIL
jgi:hypothetical protein